MKLNNIFRILPLMALASAALTGCDDDFQYPPVVVPEATMTANTTIADLKSTYWDAQAGNTWYTQIGTAANGDSLVISGIILSSDRAGNIYKNMMVRCDGGDGEAVTFAINKETGDSLICREHKPGQRIFINVTGLYIGKYNGYMEIGAASDQYGITYLDRADFDARSQVDGMPIPGQPAPVVASIEEVNDALRSPEGLMKWQSQLVRFNNVRFVDGGKETFADTSSDEADWGERNIIDESGHTIMLRNSGKSEFAYATLPTGTGDVVAILGYYNGKWQLALNGIDRTTDLIGFDWDNSGGDTPDTPAGEGDGSANAPYTVQDVIGGASGSSAWVTGYIVGWIDGKSIDEGATFSAPATANTNILLASSPDVTDAAACAPIQLQGTLRDDLGLMAHPDNLHKQVTIKGSLEKYFGQPGLKSTTAYTWGDKGDDSASGGDTPDAPTGNLTFAPASSIESGKQYIFVYEGQVAKPIQQNYTYGYLYVEDPVSVSGSELTTAAANAITIEASGSGYTLKDCYGRYLSMDDSHSSFQLYTDVQPGSVWTATVVPGGEATFSNTARAGFDIRWAANYSNLAPSSDGVSPLPLLYVKVD